MENYASLSEIKLAYKEKVRKYHPDINPDPEAVEITKYLNIAKDTLDSEENKAAYDKELKMAYLIEIQKLKTKSNQREQRIFDREKRKREKEEAYKLKVKRNYEEGIAKFPIRLRILGLTVLILWGLQLFYTHYFVLYQSYDMFFNVLGIVLFFIGVALATNEIYTYYMVESMKRAIRFHYEKFSKWFFVILVLTGPLLVSGLNQFRKQHLLTNYYIIVDAKVHPNGSDLSKVVVSYDVNGKHFAKLMKYPAVDVIFNRKRTLKIKYAIPDPRIAEIIEAPSLDGLEL